MTPSFVALVLANVLPLLGVLFLGWTVFPLVLLYWLTQPLAIARP